MTRVIARSLLIGLLAAGLRPVAPAHAQDVNPAVVSDYEARLARYEQARRAYEAEADVYWDAVTDKRRIRNAKRRQHEPIVAADYVLTQPPLYAGPPRPPNPLGAPPPPEKPEIPLVADFTQAAAGQFGFVPVRASEAAFKRAYARAARAAGLTREQVVGVYAFETGGNGAYDTQAGVTATRRRAISPALGYNQLLSTNTVSLIAEHGGRYLAALRSKARTLSGEPRHAMERKIEAFKRMMAFTRTLPHRWSEYDRVAKTTPQGIGIHAAVLDIDLGPLLQVEKLRDSVRFARAKGLARTLTAPELELMNLTGDGNGFDMVSMPDALRARVPTANFFQQNGYERNPVARRTGVVAGLIAEIQSHMSRNAQNPGARELAAAF